MTLQSSGAISMANINTELGNSSTANITLNNSSVRGLAGIASGAISLSNFYGKSSTIPIMWQVYGGGGGGGNSGPQASGGGGGGAAGVRVRSSSPVGFNPGQWYTVIIGAGGAGATWNQAYESSSGGTYSAIDSAGTWYYTTHDTTTFGWVSGGGKNGGFYTDPGLTDYLDGYYGGRGGSSYFWGQAVEYRGIEPANTANYGGGGGGASYNNGSVGVYNSTASSAYNSTYYDGGNGSQQLTTSSIVGLPLFGGGGGGGPGGAGYPPSDIYINPGFGGNGHGGNGGTVYYDSINWAAWIQVATQDAVINTGSGGGGGCGFYARGFQFSNAARGGNGSSGVVYIQYPDSYPALSYTGTYDVPFTSSGYRTYRLTSSGQFKVG